MNSPVSQQKHSWGTSIIFLIALCFVGTFLLVHWTQLESASVIPKEWIPVNEEMNTLLQQKPQNQLITAHATIPVIININTASQAQLELLPGIGKSKAQAIIEYRNQNGAFRKEEDVKKVKGIGDKIYQKISSHITALTK